MEPSIPFPIPYSSILPPWHYDGYSHHPFHDDSGYASEDPDFVPLPSPYPNNISGDPNQDQHNPSRPWRHQAAAFINAQRSPPRASRACHLLYDSRRRYDLPQPLSFEQQCKSYESGHPRASSTFYSHENSDRDTPSRGDSEEDISPLDSEEQKTRIPNTLPSLSNRIESEPDQSLSSSNPISHSSPDSAAKPTISQTRRSPTSTQPGYRNEILMRSLSLEHPYQRQMASSRDAERRFLNNACLSRVTYH